MPYQFEVESTFAPAHPAGGLVYEPVSEAVTARETRVYELDAEGDESAVTAFAERVLADRFAQKVHTDGTPALGGYTYFLDVAYHANVLDLEKQYLLQYYRSLEAPGFVLNDLTINRRIYIYGDAALLPPETLQKDLVNPVIQQAQLTAG